MIWSIAPITTYGRGSTTGRRQFPVDWLEEPSNLVRIFDSEKFCTKKCVC